MLSYNKFITEGVYDPHIFKAFFLAGGPGSGKSYVSRTLFTGTGMKMVNSDNFLTNTLKKAGQSLDLRNVEGGLLDVMRNKAKAQTGSLLDKHLANRLGIVVDGTGRDYDRLARDMAAAKRVGYDCYMIFVDTTLEVALERNRIRERKVSEPIVIKNWKGVQSNKNRFKFLFGGGNLKIVTNNKNNDNETNAQVYKSIRSLLNKPLTSWQAKAWIQKELQAKKRP
jgi:dephospho-CoA kinase|tara:strand:- start:146 stop:820 length:675 start_codon:yes stop_codon:yes gene_type:complete